jgi:hypothetical protein
MNVLLFSADEMKEKEIVTRCGYKPSDSLRAFEKALLESGAVATGKTLHFSADIVCSGGYEIWVKSIWDYAISHVGVASPRIFVYLSKRFRELDALFKQYPDETLYGTNEFHTRISEILMVLREVPRRSKVAWPKVGPETHRDGWLRTASSAADTAVLRRVWKAEGDLSSLRIAGAELLQAITEGSTEKTLFWMRWLFEEEALMKKATKGACMTSIGRGPASSKEIGSFIAELFTESYKDYKQRSILRMDEEFQVLGRLWEGADTRISPSARKSILCIMAQILCEVPRWKVAAAPALIKDPVQVSRAVTQSTKFFNEVLAHPAVANATKVQKLFRCKGEADKKKKVTSAVDAKLSAYEAAMESWMNGTGKN